MNKFKSLVLQTATYGMSSIVVRMLNYFLTPYYTLTIPKISLGIYSELFSLAALLNVIYMLGMETSFFRFSREQDNYSEVYKMTNTVVLINSFILSSLIILFSGPISWILEYPGKEVYIQVLALVLFFENACAIAFADLRYQNRAQKFVLIRVLNVLSGILLNIIFISFLYDQNIVWGRIHFSDPVTLIFIATLLPWIFTFIYFSKSIFSNIGLVNRTFFSQVFSFSLPLVIVGIAGMINEVADRIFLKHLLPFDLKTNLEQVAIYSANYKLSILMSLAVQAFRTGAEPFFFKESLQKNAKNTYAIVMDFFIIACCIILVVVSINRALIGSINEKSYVSGVVILPYLLLANLFFGVYYNASIWFKITNKTQTGAIIAIIGAILTIILNIELIPIYGYVGSAIATLACYGSMVVICIYWGSKYYSIPYHYFYNIAWIALSVIYSEAIYYFFNNQPWVLIAFSILFVITSALLSFRRWNFFNKLEIN